MKKILMGLGMLVLIACTLKINTIINFSDIISSSDKTLIADLRISVPSCSEDSINNIKTALEKRNIKATFNKCSSDNDLWNEYASFSMPINLIKDNDGKHSDIYFQYVDNGLYLKTSGKLEALLDGGDDLFAEKVNISSVEFSLVNDTDSTVSIKPSLAFVNEKPVYEENVKIEPYNKILIKIPDVANKLLEKSNAKYLIFQVVD